MRWQRADPSASEGGFTLIEMLVVLSIVGLVAALVFDSAALGIRGNFMRADRDIRAIDRAIGEKVFRPLLSDAEGVRGNGREMAVIAAVPPPGCSAQDMLVHLTLVDADGGGALDCNGRNGARAPLVTWAHGQAAFHYSSDGTVWTDRWPPARRRGARGAPAHPLVRISFPAVRGVAPAWVARAGPGA